MTKDIKWYWNGLKIMNQKCIHFINILNQKHDEKNNKISF